MKNIFFFISMLLLVLSCQAQQLQKFTIEISGGLSLPIGNFASGSSNGLYMGNFPKASAMADLGFIFQAGLNYSLKKSFGLAFLISAQENDVNQDKFMENVREGVALLSPNSGSSANDKFVGTTGSWKLLRAMVGVFYDLPIDAQKLSFRPKVLLGVLKTSIPGYTFLDATTFAYSATLETSSLPISFCYDWGATFQVNVSKRTYVSCGVDFFHAVSKENEFRSPSGSFSQNTKIPISSVNALAGIGYRL